MFSARGVGLAVACAVLGASQYAWNAAYFWQVADSAPSLAEGVRTFWFDVTKSDWRSTMVMGVHESALKRRVGLYWFDLQQQVGLAGIVLSLVGLASLWRQWRILAVLVVAYLTAFGFAYTYNVGDVHVFFLPSHQIVILAAAAGAAAVWKAPALVPASGRAAAAVILTIALFAVPAWRIWDTWPAVDRHDDTRPVAWLEGLTRGVGANGLLLADINWQLDNGLDYYIRHVRPDLNLARVTDRVLTLPLLVQPNLAAGNEVVMTPESRRLAEAAYGGLFAFAPDPRVDVRPLGHAWAPCPRTPFTCWRCSPRIATCRLTRRNWPTRPAGLLAGRPRWRRGRPIRCWPAGLASRRRSIAGRRSRSGRPCSWAVSNSTCGWSRGCRPTRYGGLVSAT